MASSSEFDPFRRVKAYSGTGTLASHKLSLECRFEAHQRGDGSIIIDCESDDVSGSWQSEAQLTGVTTSGQPLLTHGAHVTNSTMRFGAREGPSTQVRLVASQMEIGRSSRCTAFRYGLTNLRKLPSHATRTQPSESGRRRGVRLSLGALEVTIEYRPDVDSVLKELAATHSVALTAEATVAAPATEAHSVDEAIQRMCHLLTLGQGSAVAWSYRDSVDEEDAVVATFCGNAITKPYGAAHRLIKDAHIPAFVQSTYDAWDEAEARWQIRNAILGYTDAKVHVDYLELRGLKMAVVLEHLKRVYLERTRREYTIDNESFREVVPALRTQIMAALKDLFAESSRQELGHTLAALIGGLNRTPFREAIRGVATELNLPLDNEELRTLAAIRNRLVHAMQFDDDIALSMSEQFDFLSDLAGRFILAALDYRGPYYDWRTRPRPTIAQLERLADPPS